MSATDQTTREPVDVDSLPPTQARGTCSVCGLRRRVRRDGAIEAHRPLRGRTDLIGPDGRCEGGQTKVRGNRLIDETGNRYGRWLVVSLDETNTQRAARWLCRCDCGAEASLLANKLRRGPLPVCKSCDPRFHGRSKSASYRLWAGMLHRCLKPYDQAYANYGGRGITVCERWLIFENFYADMGERPPGRSLDRIDNDGPYSPENCRWATLEEQHRNRRDNRLVTYQGRTEPVAEWARLLKMPYDALISRIYRGWPIERAFTEPVSRPKKVA